MTEKIVRESGNLVKSKNTYEIEAKDDERIFVKHVEWNGIHQFKIMEVDSRDEALAVINAWENGENANLVTRAGREYFKSLFA